MCGPCSAGGTAWALAAFLAGLDPSDKAGLTSWLKERGLIGTRDNGGKISHTYPYTDENQNLLFQVLRYEPKSFKQRRPNGNGGWIWNIHGVRRVPYRLSEVLAAEQVIIPEGEKDVDSIREELRKRNLLGPWAVTCNPGGAGKWRSEYSEYLRGKLAYITCDRDDPGLAHGRDVGANLLGIAREARIVEKLTLASGRKPKDVSDFMHYGGEFGELIRQLENGLLITPDVVAAWRSMEPKNEQRIRSKVDRKPRMAAPVTTANLKLPDGRIAEVVTAGDRVEFCIFSPGARTFATAEKIEIGGQVYFPQSGPFVTTGAILLPPLPNFLNGEDSNLFDDLCCFVHSYWLGSANWIRVTVLYILMSWVIHCLEEVPYERLIGDLGTGKSRFCDVVQAIAYRAIRGASNITAGVLPRALTRYPDATLIVDEADIGRDNGEELRLILRCGSSRRTPVLKCVPGSSNGHWEASSFFVFGPKILAVRKVTKDDALESRCITHSVGKTEQLGKVPVTLPPQFWDEAVALRARLMAFRIMNYGCVREFRQAIADTAEELLAGGLDSRTVQLGAPLLALSEMLNHSVASESCLRVLRHYDISVQLERGQGLDGLLARFVQGLRDNGVTELELTAFRGSLKSFAEEEEDWAPDFIPKKQPLSRRLNAFARVLGIRVIPRKSGHSDSTVVILARGTKEAESSAPLPSVPITVAESDAGAEGAEPSRDT